MSQPKKAFNEVRAILGKLDRSREELRQRTNGSQNPEPAAAKPPTPTPPATPAPAVPRPGAAAPAVGGAQAKPPVPPTPGSRFGRAQPIRPSGSDALGRWNPPGQ